MSIQRISSHRECDESKVPEEALPPAPALYLDNTPPPAVWERMMSAFEDVQQRAPNWRDNGQPTYDIAGVEDHQLIARRIRQMFPDQKTYTIVDLGEGDGSWALALARSLERENLPKDIKVHIIGVKGEKINNARRRLLWDQKISTLGQCTINSLGLFFLEDFEAELAKRGFDLKGKIDFVITRWALRHCANPMRIFQQVMDHLAPGAFFLFDGFFFFEDNQNPLDYSNYAMPILLSRMGLSFLTKYYFVTKSLNHYVIQKGDSLEPCRVPLRYTGEIVDMSEVWGFDCASKCITCFEFTKCGENFGRFDIPGNIHYRAHGSKKLHEFLRQNHCLFANLGWAPLTDCDEQHKHPSLLTLAQYGDIEAITNLLQKGCDLNESDYLGRTVLHIAVASGDERLLAFLLDQEGIIIDLPDHKNLTPFQLATKLGKENMAAMLAAKA